MKRKKEKKKKTHVPFRLNMLFFIVFILFSVLILRLGFVQIVHGDDYRRELERTEDITVSNAVPRGIMYDSNMKPMVDNERVDTITYTRQQQTKTEEMLETAEKLAVLIEKDEKKVTERDKKDFWILKNPEEAEKKITKKEKKQYEEGKLDSKGLYKLQLEKITEEDLADLTDEDMEVLAIYREMASAKMLTPQIIKNEGVTKEEVALVSENLELLPGIDVTTDWNRKYLFGDTLKSVIGKVTSSEEGLPLEKLEYYKSRDYSNNDRVGKSYLEMQYEDVLRGQKAKTKNITDKSGKVLESIPVSEGKRGNDLILTIDMDLQLAVEEIIEKQLREKKSFGSTYLLDRAFVVLMDPNTGEILTMAGKQYVKDDGKAEIRDFALGNITSAYAMGSAIKGATVLAGFETGVNSPSTTYYDTKMYFAGTKKGKGSSRDLGPVNAVRALQKSSNVYMFHTAIKMGNGNYVKNGPLNIDKEKAFNTLRYYYNQFGLGVRTGIDLPNELPGFKGVVEGAEPGKVLDLSIGQYDMYTPMQLAQYVSTIANGGKRIQPHLVKEIREPSVEEGELGPVIQEFAPKVLNTIDMDQNDIEVVQKGMRQVMQTGGTAAIFAGSAYKPAGKTGTAEAFYDGPNKNFKNAETINTTLVGYAPFDNPEIAMSVVVPWAYQRGNNHNMSKEIGKEVMDKYFELKEKRSGKANKEQSSSDDED